MKRKYVLYTLVYMYMEIHVFSTLAYEKKGNPPNHFLDKQTYIARDTWMPSLENWGGGLNEIVICAMYMYMYMTQITISFKLHPHSAKLTAMHVHIQM